MGSEPKTARVERALHDSFEHLLRVTRSTRRHEQFLQAPGLAGVSLTRGESFLLAEVSRSAPVRLSALAVTLGLDRSIASRQADALVRGGLVERSADPADGRATLLRPTDQGAAVLQALRDAREQWLSEVVAGLAADEVAALTAVLPRLVAAIDAAETEHRG